MEEIKYDQMKDSGIEWIGDIPKEWKIRKAKNIFEIFGSGSTPDSGNSDYYDGCIKWIQSGDLYKTKYVNDTSKSITEEGRKSSSALKVYSSPFIALAMYGASVGNLSISNIDASVNQAVAVMDSKSNNIKFYYYAFEASKQELIASAQGGTQPNISQILLKNWRLPFPPTNEQSMIAEFLDKKTQEINKGIQIFNKSIELLKGIRKSIIFETVTKGLDNNVEMKDSGVEWIGEIPVEWEYSKIRYTTRLNGRIGWQGLTSDEYTDEGPYLITGTDFSEGKVNLETAVHISYKRWQEAKEIQVKNGDLLITKDGTVGKVAMIDGLDSEASLNSGVLRIRTYNQVDTRYLYWILNSEVFWNWFNYTNGGNSTILHLYQNVFEKFSFPLPNIAVQKKISDFLDKNISTLDESIKKVEESISLAEQIKKSLIYEYTTGKKRVRL
jgi:type I restriction enzyme S subunit